jgi:hypothetical protein
MFLLGDVATVGGPKAGVFSEGAASDVRLSYRRCGRGLMRSNASQSSRGGENTSMMTAP